MWAPSIHCSFVAYLPSQLGTIVSWATFVPKKSFAGVSCPDPRLILFGRWSTIDVFSRQTAWMIMTMMMVQDHLVKNEPRFGSPPLFQVFQYEHHYQKQIVQLDLQIQLPDPINNWNILQRRKSHEKGKKFFRCLVSLDAVRGWDFLRNGGSGSNLRCRKESTTESGGSWNLFNPTLHQARPTKLLKFIRDYFSFIQEGGFKREMKERLLCQWPPRQRRIEGFSSPLHVSLLCSPMHCILKIECNLHNIILSPVPFVPEIKAVHLS